MQKRIQPFNPLDQLEPFKQLKRLKRFKQLKQFEPLFRLERFVRFKQFDRLHLFELLFRFELLEQFFQLKQLDRLYLLELLFVLLARFEQFSRIKQFEPLFQLNLFELLLFLTGGYMPLFNWTGNPWVDAGLAVMVAKSGKEKIEDFTDKDFETILSDVVWLAKANRQLNAFTMVVGINSPLTNTSLNPSLKKKNRGKLNPMDDKGIKQYCDLIKELKESVLKNTDGKFLCESCGERPVTEVLSKYEKEIGRDWFPLAGSIGNDAQMLPAASRTARICSLCLLSIQFLPLGTIAIKVYPIV